MIRMAIAMVVAAAFLAGGAGSPWAQSAGAPAKFDVISIKVSKTPGVGVGRINLTQPGGHLAASNVSVKFLAIQAYQFGRVHFGPDPKGAEWIESEHFDIAAEVEGNPTEEQKRLMLQSLLADRFKFAIHHETQQLPIYALQQVKAGRLGPELRPHSDDTKCVNVPAGAPLPPPVAGGVNLPPCGGLRVIGNDLIAQNVTMEQLARTLSVLMDRDVADRTGLAGNFDLRLHFQIAPPEPADVPADPSAPPSILTALREQLGLKLETRTGPVDVIVIDHVERPVEN